MSSEKLILYTNPMSRGRVVRWMLEEIGAPYETHVFEFGTQMKSLDYLKINPMGKVPALVHGAAVVTEAVAICSYLAEMFPDAGLLPASNDAAAKGSYARWLYFVAGPLESAVTDRVLGLENVPSDKQGFVGYGTYDSMVSTLETCLKDKEFIAGNHFTTADLIMCAYLSFYMQFDSLPKKKVFEDYVKLHESRPAHVRATKIDDGLIAKSKAS